VKKRKNNPSEILFASMPTDQNGTLTLNNQPQYGFEPILWTLFIPAHRSEWYTYFKQFDALVPYGFWNLTSKTFASLPAAQNGTVPVPLLWTICCHSPNTDLSPYFKNFASIPAAQNGTGTLTGLGMVHLLRIIGFPSPNMDLNPYFEHFRPWPQHRMIPLL
jgi:hypothetical protein